MADVKWIKITTDIFDDEKVLLIESLPDAYAIITVWFKLLCLAGKQNNSGVFMMGRVAYTDKMLATIFRMKESTVTMALQTFEQFGMVEIIDGVITIPNWNKHQTLDAYEKKKERDRLYQAERRANQRALIEQSSDNKTTQSSDVAFSEEDKEKDKEEDKDVSSKQAKRKRFTPPTLDEVTAYCEERKNGINAQKFIDYYTANGWKVGRTKMQDWQAAVRTWERNEYGNGKQGQSESSFDVDDFMNAALKRTYGEQNGGKSGRAALDRGVVARMEENAANEAKTAADDDEIARRAAALREKIAN